MTDEIEDDGYVTVYATPTRAEDDPYMPPQDVLDAFAKDCRNGCGTCHGGRPCDGCMAGGVCDQFSCECDEQPFGDDDDCERDEWPG